MAARREDEGDGRAHGAGGRDTRRSGDADSRHPHTITRLASDALDFWHRPPPKVLYGPRILTGPSGIGMSRARKQGSTSRCSSRARGSSSATLTRCRETAKSAARLSSIRSRACSAWCSTRTRVRRGHGPRTRATTLLMGLHWDLEWTMRNATIETIKFLTQEMGLTDVKALSAASIGVDRVNSEVVEPPSNRLGFLSEAGLPEEADAVAGWQSSYLRAHVRRTIAGVCPGEGRSRHPRLGADARARGAQKRAPGTEPGALAEVTVSSWSGRDGLTWATAGCGPRASPGRFPLERTRHVRSARSRS